MHKSLEKEHFGGATLEEFPEVAETLEKLF